MGRQIQISFILVHFNGYPLTRACIESIVRFADGIPMEIVVVDNASTDDSTWLLKRDFGNRIRLILNETNRGYAAACNRGIAAAKGDYLFVLNNDLAFTRRCFDSVDGLFRSYPHLGMLGFQLINPDGTLQPSHFHFPTISRRIYQILLKPFLRPITRVRRTSKESRLVPVDYIKGALMVFRQSVLKDHGLVFDERYFLYHEEMDLAFRLKQRGQKILFCPLPTAVHVGQNHESPENPTVLSMRNESLLYFIRKHRSSLYFKAFALVQVMAYGLKWVSDLVFLGMDRRIYQKLIRVNISKLWNHGTNV